VCCNRSAARYFRKESLFRKSGYEIEKGRSNKREGGHWYRLARRNVEAVSSTGLEEIAVIFL